MRIANLPIERPIATLMLLVSLAVLGVVAIFKLPLGFMPAFTEPRVECRVDFPGSHPLEALAEVARPLEGEVATVPGVRRVRSFVRPGFVEVTAVFDWSQDMDIKQLDVREAVERVRPLLPLTVGHVQVSAEVGGPGGEILEARISATRDLSESFELLNTRIVRPLERVKGVARVELSGVEAQQLRVELDLSALRAHGIQAGEVLRRLDAYNVDADVGAVTGDLLRYDVRTLGRFRGVDDVSSLPLGHGGLRLSDVARVKLAEPRLPYGRHLDRRFAVGITVHKEPTANTVETVDALLARVDEIEHDPLLQGITLLVWENAGEAIRNSIGGLRDAGIFGGVLAVFVLFFFLRRVRTTAVVALAIPFSLVVTCGVMYVLGSEFNVLTMLGLMFGVGMLVDNAVVVIENIHRRHQQGLSAKEAARKGVREVFLAVVASTATTIIVWSWLFVFPRDELTIMMGQVAMTICLAVACSLLVSLTLIPLAASRFPSSEEVRPGWVSRRLVPSYRRLLGFTLRHRVLSLGVLFLLGVSFAIPFSRMEKSDQVRMQERMVELRYLVHDPAAKDVLEGHVDRVEEWLIARQDDLGFEHVYSWFSEEWGSMTRLYLPREVASEDQLEEVRRKLREDLPSIPGVTFRLGRERWWEMRESTGRQVQVALHGEDPEYLRVLAERVEDRLADVPGVLGLRGPGVTGQLEARIRVDTDKARGLGLDPRRIGETVAFAFRGQNLRRFQQEQGEVEVVVALPRERQPSLSDLSLLPLPRTDGEPVPLGSVASLEIGRTPPTLWREDRRTTERVGVDFDKEVTTQEAQQRVSAALAPLSLPEGYAWSFGSWGQRRDEGLETMSRGVLLSLFVVVILLMALFESFTQPLAIIVTLPLAFSGAFWSLWALGHDLEPVAFMGLIILVGVVVNNGIVMVDHVNQLRASGRARVDALVEGCGDRMRPVLMTAITTVFGLVPLALADPTVAGAYIDSCAVAVIGGLTTSTVFTLLGLPVWYSVVEDVGSILLDLVPRRAKPAASAARPA